MLCKQFPEDQRIMLVRVLCVRMTTNRHYLVMDVIENCWHTFQVGHRNPIQCGPLWPADYIRKPVQS